MADDKKTPKVTKQTSAAKRHKQSLKRREQNRFEKSRIRTAIRRVEDAIAKNDQKCAIDALPTVYSLLDKGVKSGVLKLNKASRTKARLTAKAHAKTA